MSGPAEPRAADLGSGGAVDDDTIAAPDVLRASAQMAAGTAASRVTGLIRVGALTFALGRTAMADAFYLANVAPNLIYELALGGVLSASLVPLFAAAADRRRNHADSGDRTAGSDETSVLFTVAFVALIGVTVAAIGGITLLSGPFSHMLQPTSGADATVRRTTVTALAQLALPQILFYGLTTLCTSVLNARRRFVAAAFAPVLNNVVSSIAFVVVGIRLGDARSVTSLAVLDTPTLVLLGLGATAGVIAMTVALFTPVVNEVELRWTFEPRHPVVRRLLGMSGWMIGYVVANQVTLLVVYALAGRAQTGTLTAYTTAFIFFQLPHGLFAVSLMTTTLPELARASSRNDRAGFQRQWLEGLRLIWLAMLPAAVGYALVATPLMSLLLERGRFSGTDAVVVGRTLAAFAAGLPGFSVYLYALRAFYAGQDTRTPFVLNMIENLLNLGFIAIFGASSAWQLALAFSAAYTMSAIIAVWHLHRRLDGLGQDVPATLKVMAQIVAVTALMAGAVALCARFIGSDHGGGAALRVLAATVIGSALYLAGSTLMHIDGTDRLVRVATRVLPNRRSARR